MYLKHSAVATLMVAMSVSVVAQDVKGAGFDNNLVGLKGASMASAFHGIADDGSAVYYNPAGLALIDKGEMNVEAYTYLIFTKFRYEAATPVGTVKGESTEMPVIPGGFITQSFDRWGIGLGVFVPYGGGGVVYKNFFPATGDTLEASAGFFAVGLSGAVEIVEKYLSIGVTPTIYLGAMENRMNPQEDPTGQTRVVSTNSGYAGFGGSLGIMSAPIPQLKLGLTLRSPVQVTLDGDVTTTSPALPAPMKYGSTLRFLIPMELSLGVGFNPIPTLTLGLSATIIFHGMMDEISMKTTTLSPTTGQEEKVEQINQTHYKHNFRIGLGAEYMFIKQLGVRGGVQFIQSPTKDAGLVPTSNDVNQLGPSLGLAWKMVRFLELDVTGQYVVGFEREKTSDIPGMPAGTTMTEKFDADHWILLAGLRFNWDFIP